MSKDGFARAYARVRVYEGGNVDDPHDPGGRTSRGVTQRVYTAWLRRQKLPDADVWKAPDAHIQGIYRELYWDRCHCDELPAGVDFIVFDSAVNSGTGQAGRWLQRALEGYTGAVDGNLSAVTLQAVNDDADNDALIGRMLARRLGTLRGLKTWGRYGKGWSARIANVQKIGQAWATGSVGPDPVAVDQLGGHRKAVVSEDTMRRPLLGTTSTTITTGAASVASVASETATQFEAFRELFSWMPYVLGGLAVLAAAAGIIVKLGHAAADRAREGDDVKPVDPTADEDATPVAVNDNVPAEASPQAAEAA
ncbi:glycoside hydrolase family 108 protein [Methylobacterium gnaphalii]|uniref:TtsA-like Glycoside hydrolase family 108 domain-containing protein n=1 Tax=Methylobacterium gnaphalii TaxID=1010610 RepID=A0A512JPG2_9HYPH|nr:glycosyl hydrolase 108 family protein [Methylobacterium gnaphalii]GEP11838.1 hypothetical protein MGN01_36830 [Methylobacterium gnaphalii]GJD69422.1 hypothetical protein MMMDOFMJ_2353 [Methylobacterium gnaphalii]GLS49622.1 hypothetical protein GCM10007885_24710 [Methylobacterium gnaphalii]